MQKLNVDEAVADIGSAAAALRAMPEVTGKVAAIGYCFADASRIWLRRKARSTARSPITAAASRPSSNWFANIKVPMQFHYGELDAHIPLSAMGEIQERFAGRTDVDSTFIRMPITVSLLGTSRRITSVQLRGARPHVDFPRRASVIGGIELRTDWRF